MTQMESPKRKMQKKNDYQRHKLFRKIKRRRKAQAEAQQEVAEKQLKKKLKLPKFGGGKTREVYTSDIHFNNDDAAGGIDRYGNKFDYIELPEMVVTARRIPTFKDIEKQIGRKITQDEIDKVVAADPEIPLQVSSPKEKGLVQPSITNEVFNTIVGSAGDVVNYVANKAGLPNLAPNEQFIETKDGDALFDLPGYGQAAKVGLYGLGRYGGKLGLNTLQNSARKAILNREFTLSNIDEQLAKDVAYNKPWHNNEIVTSTPKKQKRLQLSQPTYQIYRGNKHSVSEVIDDKGNVNLANLLKIQNEALDNIPGGRIARHRLENPDWHKTDWNTFMHSRDAYQRALQAGYPKEVLFPTLMHDAGKLWAGDGHGPYGASIIQQMFPDATKEQIAAIYQHMDKVPESAMGKLVKGADIAEGNQFRDNVKNLTFQIRGEKTIGRKFQPSQAQWNIDDKNRRELIKYLNNNGYDTSVMSARDAEDLEEARTASIINSGINSGKRFGIFSNRLNDWVDLYNKTGSRIGELSVDNNGIKVQNKLAKYTEGMLPIQGYWNTDGIPGVHMVRNLTINQKSPENGVSKDLYDIFLQAMRQKGSSNGLLTGVRLLQPEKTIRVTSNKNYRSITIPNTGWHDIPTQNGRKSVIGDSKILLYPRNPDVNFKSTAFDPSIIDENGNIITDFNNPSMYYNSGKDIRIKPSKRGTFTKAAKAHGMSVQGFANKVLKNPSKYSAAMRKKANFARNASRWNH